MRVEFRITTNIIKEILVFFFSLWIFAFCLINKGASSKISWRLDIWAILS